MPRKRRSRVYLRGSRYWGDFRDYITVGGKLEALVPPGDHLATTDLDVANKLAGERLQELERGSAERTSSASRCRRRSGITRRIT